jgi:hypothetical protein
LVNTWVVRKATGSVGEELELVKVEGELLNGTEGILFGPPSRGKGGVADLGEPVAVMFPADDEDTSGCRTTELPEEE